MASRINYRNLTALIAFLIVWVALCGAAGAGGTWAVMNAIR